VLPSGQNGQQSAALYGNPPKILLEPVSSMRKRGTQPGDYTAISPRALALAALLAGCYHSGQIAGVWTTKNAPESLNLLVDPDFNESSLTS